MTKVPLVLANRALVASREPGTEPADWKFYNAAEVTTMGVYTVPARMPLNEFKARQLPDHHIGLRNFRPMFVANLNPGTLTGVYATFMRLFEIMEPQYNQGHYLPWKFDVAIYNNYLKVWLGCRLSVFSLVNFLLCFIVERSWLVTTKSVWNIQSSAWPNDIELTFCSFFGAVLSIRRYTSLLHSGTNQVLCFFRSTMKELIWFRSYPSACSAPFTRNDKIALLFSFHYEPTNFFFLNFFLSNFTHNSESRIICCLLSSEAKDIFDTFVIAIHSWSHSYDQKWVFWGPSFKFACMLLNLLMSSCFVDGVLKKLSSFRASSKKNCSLAGVLPSLQARLWGALEARVVSLRILRSSSPPHLSDDHSSRQTPFEDSWVHLHTAPTRVSKRSWQARRAYWQCGSRTEMLCRFSSIFFSVVTLTP